MVVGSNTKYKYVHSRDDDIYEHGSNEWAAHQTRNEVVFFIINHNKCSAVCL